MWLFLPFGFYSVVAIHQNDRPTDHLFVRSRDREDAAMMAAKLRELSHRVGGTICRCSREGDMPHDTSCPAYVPLHINVTPKHDYRFRIMIHRSMWALALAEFAEVDLTYPNFKAEVYRAQGVEREQLYAKVWAIVRSFRWAQ